MLDNGDMYACVDCDPWGITVQCKEIRPHYILQDMQKVKMHRSTAALLHDFERICRGSMETCMGGVNAVMQQMLKEKIARDYNSTMQSKSAIYCYRIP